MSKDEVLERIRETGILPVIRASSAEEAKAVVAAIREGGIDVFEITMTVPGAAGLIDDLARDEGLLIGAGTVTDAEEARVCISAGARFIVSPATDFDTILYCNDADIAVMPGALTPTEVVNAWEAGADVVKIFPASAMGGPGYLKALKTPLPHIKLIPTGGINLENVADYLSAGAEAVGVGGDLVDLNAIRSGKSEKLTLAAQKYLETINGEPQN